MKEIKAYQCDFCRKYYKQKSSGKRHEDRCYYNPVNRACLTCGNFKKLEEVDDEDLHFIWICKETGKDFNAEKFIDRQEFQNRCRKWKPIEIT